MTQSRFQKSIFKNLINYFFIILIFSSCNSKNIKTDSPSTPAAALNTSVTTDTKESKTQEAPVEKVKTKQKKSKSETQVANSNVKEVSQKNESLCKSNDDERKLLISTVNEGCKLDYIKNDETKTIATQIIGNQKCEEVFNSIKNKLVAANFNCN